MTLVLNGTTGVSSVDGSASTPAIQGADTNTGVFFPAADTVAWATGGSERARIDSSGNMGVGTSSPGTKLDVAGTVRGSGSALNPGTTAWVNAAFRGTSSYGGGLAFVDGSDGAIIYASGQNLIFGNGATSGGTTERARIDTSGNLLIGTTTSSGSNGIVAAGVYNNTTASGANVQVDNTGPGLLRRSTSSIQYKTQVENIAPEFIDNVLKFRPVWYRSLCEGDRKDWSWYGLIAEEVAELDPRLVHWRQYDTSVDADGNTVQTKLDQPVAEGVMYDRVVVLALAKIQELKAELDALKAQVAGAQA